MALRGAGSEAPIMTSEGGPQNPIARLAGDAAEGSVHTYAGADPTGSEAARRLIERCEREIGGAPSFALETYEAVMVIAGALRGGATTRAEVRDAIASSAVEGFNGPIRFDASGERIGAPVSLWRVAGSRMVPVFPASAFTRGRAR